MAWQSAYKVCDRKIDTLDTRPSVKPEDQLLPHYKTESGACYTAKKLGLVVTTVRSNGQHMQTLANHARYGQRAFWSTAFSHNSPTLIRH